MSQDQKGKYEYGKLWQLIRRKDQKAFEILFRQLNERMFNYGYKIIQDPELIKDAIQDVFMTIWRRSAYLSDVSSVPAYLFVALKRRLYRKIKNEGIYSDLELSDSIESELFKLNPEELSINEDSFTDYSKESILQAINNLPGKKREVIYLFFYNGMDYEEISQIMELDIQTVRNYMSIALKKMRIDFFVKAK